MTFCFMENEHFKNGLFGLHKKTEFSEFSESIKKGDFLRSLGNVKIIVFELKLSFWSPLRARAREGLFLLRIQ
jgi:hypothetical protein